MIPFCGSFTQGTRVSLCDQENLSEVTVRGIGDEVLKDAVVSTLAVCSLFSFLDHLLWGKPASIWRPISHADQM